MYNNGNSSKNVTGSSIVDGTVETADIADDAVTVAKLNSDVKLGKVLQVVQTTGAAQTTITAAATWTAVTGASVTITPSSTSSKVLVSFNCSGLSVGAVGEIGLRIIAGSSEIKYNPKYGYGSTTNIHSSPVFYEFLHSPATTSAVTYRLDATKSAAAGQLEVNSGGGTNSLVSIAMEIGV
jgi:hypothetical protein